MSQPDEPARARAHVKIFGERNTATRALARVLKSIPEVTLRMPEEARAAAEPSPAVTQKAIAAHFCDVWRRVYMDALRDNTNHISSPLKSWKHSAPRWHVAYQIYDVTALFMVRNPYSWAISMACNSYHAKGPDCGDFPDFLARPWLCDWRDNTPRLLPNVIALWNEKLRAYQAFMRAAHLNHTKARLLHFEDFVDNPKLSVARALDTLGLSWSHMSPPAGSTKNEAEKLEDLQYYYRQEMWRARLTRSAVAQINATLDPGLMAEYGYTQLRPEDFPDCLPVDEARRFRAEMLKIKAVAEPRKRARLLDREAGAAAAAGAGIGVVDHEARANELT